MSDDRHVGPEDRTGADVVRVMMAVHHVGDRLIGDLLDRRQ